MTSPRRLAPLVFGLLTLGMGAQQPKVVLPLWPHGTPEPAQTSEPEGNTASAAEVQRAGHPIQRTSNVTEPTMAVFSPAGGNTGVAALVFPGGGYVRLAMDIEGDDTCKWLNSIGMTCLLVKYRVPEKGYYPENPADLQDAQQAMRLARAHASEWGLDPKKIGVVGFSAGGNLAVLLCTHPDDRSVESSPAAAEVHADIDARPDFAILGYPAYLGTQPGMRELQPVYAPDQFTPPTFIAFAEDDKTYGPNSLVYYRALMDAHIPAELHAFASGGHGFGTFPAAGKPEVHWTDLATTFLHTQGILH